MLQSVREIAQDTIAGWWKDRAMSMGAAIAYYAAFSLAPMLLLVIAIAGLVFGHEAAQGVIVNELSALIGKEGAGLLEQMIAESRSLVSGLVGVIVGLMTILIVATGALVEIQTALNIIWRAKEPETIRGIWGFIRSRLLTFALITSIAFLLLVSLVVDAALSAASDYLQGAFPGVRILLISANFAMGLVFAVLLFGLTFAILPNVETTWREVGAGALLSGILFTIGKFVIVLIVARSGATSAYGASASIITIMLWIFYSSQILLLGAEFGRAYERRFGNAGWTTAS